MSSVGAIRVLASAKAPEVISMLTTYAFSFPIIYTWKLIKSCYFLIHVCTKKLKKPVWYYAKQDETKFFLEFDIYEVRMKLV